MRSITFAQERPGLLVLIRCQQTMDCYRHVHSTTIPLAVGCLCADGKTPCRLLPFKCGMLTGARELRIAHRWHRPAVAVDEQRVALVLAVNSILTAMQRTVMLPTECHQVVEVGFPAVRPVMDVVALDLVALGATRIAAAAVS